MSTPPPRLEVCHWQKACLSGLLWSWSCNLCILSASISSEPRPATGTHCQGGYLLANVIIGIVLDSLAVYILSQGEDQICMKQEWWTFWFGQLCLSCRLPPKSESLITIQDKMRARDDMQYTSQIPFIRSTCCLYCSRAVLQFKVLPTFKFKFQEARLILEDSWKQGIENWEYSSTLAVKLELCTFLAIQGKYKIPLGCAR